MKTPFRAAAAAAGLALTLLLSPAHAAERYVTFGDSLSDPGNLFSIAGQPPAPYYQGHFSNGLTWIEQLTGAQQTYQTFGGGGNGNVDFAFGGARTDANIFSGGRFTPFGLLSQIQSYLTRGGTFSATDTVSIWAGGNNLLDAFDSTYPGYVTPTVTTLTAVMTSASADIKAAVTTLVNNGARKIVVLNLPDLGLAPAFRGTAGQSGATYASNVFNSQLAADLAAIKAANPGLDIVQVDVKSVFDLVNSNPKMFGFTNSTDSCVATTSCVTGSKDVQNQYAFWDKIHPTEAAHKLIALVVTQYLTWDTNGAGLARIADSALTSRSEAAGRSLARFDEIRRGAKRAGAPYVELIGSSAMGSSGDGRASFRHNAVGLAFGAHAGLSESTAAIVEGYVQGGGFRGGLYGGDFVSVGADGAVAWTSGEFFVRGGGGVSASFYSDVSRTTLAGLRNSADHLVAGGGALAEAGMYGRLGPVDVSPRLRLGWMGLHIGDATESGVIAPLTVKERTAATAVGAVELQSTYEILRVDARRISLTGLIGYERWFGMSGYRAETTLANNTAVTRALGGSNPTGPGVLAGLGLGGSLTETASFSVSYRASLGQNATRQEARAGVQLRF